MGFSKDSLANQVRASSSIHYYVDAFAIFVFYAYLPVVQHAC